MVQTADGQKKMVSVSKDEGVRPGTTREVLAGLKPVFSKTGATTAGNSSQVCCGAARDGSEVGGVGGFDGGRRRGMVALRGARRSGLPTPFAHPGEGVGTWFPPFVVLSFVCAYIRVLCMCVVLFTSSHAVSRLRDTLGDVLPLLLSRDYADGSLLPCLYVHVFWLCTRLWACVPWCLCVPEGGGSRARLTCKL